MTMTNGRPLKTRRARRVLEPARARSLPRERAAEVLLHARSILAVDLTGPVHVVAAQHELVMTRYGYKRYFEFFERATDEFIDRIEEVRN